MLKTNYESNACLLLETDLRWLLWRLGLLLRALKSGLWPVMLKNGRDSFRKARKAHLIHKAKTIEPMGINKRDEL